MLLVACSSGSQPDGQLIDGIWVGDPISCDAIDAAGSPTCARVIECGTYNEFEGDPPAIRDVVVYNKPTRNKDGTLLAYGMGGFIVVFVLATGQNRAANVIETDPGFCE